MDRCKITESEVVIVDPDRVNITCMHDTLFCQIDIRITNNH